MRDKDMSNSHCGLLAKWSKNNTMTLVVDTNKGIGRALGALWKLHEIKTNDIKGSCWKWILLNRGSLSRCWGGM